MVVDNILKQYGLRIQNEDYSEESATIESLLNDFSKADVLIATAKLKGVSETITAVDVAEKDFENMALQQAEGESVKKDLDSASKFKKESIAEINKNLVGYMNIMANINPATYEAIAKIIAELMDKNNELVKCRRKTGEADSEVA